jgi:pseudoazurin
MRLGLFASLLLMTAPAMAADYTVEMLNNKDGQMYAYSEKLLKIAKGDTVTWKATNMGHNAVFVPKAFPDGATPLDGMLSKDVSYMFTVPGVYVVKCNPHFGLGMLQVIVVDNNLSNLDQVKAANYPGKAKTSIDEILASLSNG